VVIDFYDVKAKKRVRLEDNRVTKVIYESEAGRTTYGIRGKTRDGRTLSKFINKDEWDSLNVPKTVTTKSAKALLDTIRAHMPLDRATLLQLWRLYGTVATLQHVLKTGRSDELVPVGSPQELKVTIEKALNRLPEAVRALVADDVPQRVEEIIANPHYGISETKLNAILRGLETLLRPDNTNALQAEKQNAPAKQRQA
jgi:hypothetical protein